MRRECIRCGFPEPSRNVRRSKCGGQKHKYVKSAGRASMSDKFMRSVKFGYVTPMAIPCSWMPGGFIQIGGQKL